jgi:hypothetical protein
MAWSVALPNIGAMEIHTIRRFFCESMGAFEPLTSLDVQRRDERRVVGGAMGAGAGAGASNFDDLVAPVAAGNRPVRRFRNT